MEINFKNTISDWIDWIKRGEVFPHFQPIISVQNKSVFGYEVLGRIQTSDGNLHTLGDFFNAHVYSHNSEENSHFLDFQQSIDNQIIKKALYEFKNHSEPYSKLFINLSPMKLWNFHRYIDSHDNLPPIFKEVIELSIDPNRIVIEITEDYVQYNLELLKPLIAIYKGFGFGFAIDDLGSRASNLDRIAIFQPEILKVEMNFLKKSLSDRNYKEILYSVCQLGENLGISLLFEGIETIQELTQAMSFGSRYIQGFIFDKALNHFPEKEKYKENMNSFIKSFYLKKQSNISLKLLKENDTERLIESIQLKIQFDEKNVNIISYLEIFSIDKNFFRLYTTNYHGDQISPNYTKVSNGNIEIENDIRNNNWSWRPFFSNHIYQSKKNRRNWSISHSYRDIKEDYIIKTISITLSFDIQLFIDFFFDDEL
jgi:EAL domain-containing protein (putative c-di-GMP-specific phosphodiesterase class I)